MNIFGRRAGRFSSSTDSTPLHGENDDLRLPRGGNVVLGDRNAQRRCQRGALGRLGV
jgi:hypothetical protein